MTHIIIRDVALVTDLWCFGSSFGSGAPRMSVAGPSRRLPSCRRRKRLRPGVGWWGSPVRFIVDLGCGYPFLVWFDFPLVVVLWCVGNPDLWDRGLVCFWGTFLLWLVFPNLPIAWAQARARITSCLFLEMLGEFELMLMVLFEVVCWAEDHKPTHGRGVSNIGFPGVDSLSILFNPRSFQHFNGFLKRRTPGKNGIGRYP